MKLTHEAIAQIRGRAAEWKRRNPDTIVDADDFARIAEARWVAKACYYAPEKGSLEQFTGMVCSNVESELAADVIAEVGFRRACVSLDKAVGEDGRMTVADVVSSSASGTRRYWLRYDVRETIANLTAGAFRDAMNAALEGQTVREMAARWNMPTTTFCRTVWKPAVAEFKRLWR